MTIGEIIKQYRKENGLSQREFAKRCGVSNGYISMIEIGVNPSTGEAPMPSLTALKGIAKGMNTTLQNLFSLADDLDIDISGISARVTYPTPEEFEKYGLRPITKKRVPLLGNIPCGEPKYADEDIECYVEIGNDVKADFCLRAKGDSMIGARIHDGDLVFIRSTPLVDNGQIAAVIIDDEATLKRVYYYPENNMIILKPENSKYKDLIYLGDQLETVRILGLAVGLWTETF